jgi:hypothetical protein
MKRCLPPGVLALAATLGCASLPGGDRTRCDAPPSQALVPFAPRTAESLAGDYHVVLVSQSGPRSGKSSSGELHLVRNDTLHRYYLEALGAGWRRRGDRPLYGWTKLQVEVGLATAGTPLESRASDQPGVVTELDSLVEGFRLRLGYRPMFDGGWNELTVTRLSPAGFAGRWKSSVGITDYRATGYFCAERVAPPA